MSNGENMELQKLLSKARRAAEDYGMIEATLVFLCILRLTMFSPKSKTITANMK